MKQRYALPRVLVGTSTPAERLEYIRDQLGFETVKDFWRELSEGGLGASYEAARNYHLQGREPTPAYYAAVARRFGVHLPWLIEGNALNRPAWEREYLEQQSQEAQAHWPMASAEEAESLAEAVPFYHHIGSRQPLFLELWEWAARQSGAAPYDLDVARRLAHAILAPLPAAPDFSSPAFREYLDAVVVALRLAIAL